jgi:amidase
VETLARSGIAVEEIDFDLSAGREAFLTLRGHWFATWMARRLERLEGFGVNVRRNTEAGLAGSGRDLGAAEAVRGSIWHRMQELFERFDHLLTPTMAVPPFPVEQNYPDTVAGKPMKTYVDWLAPTFVLSLTGLPVASVPCGRDGGGMPVGLQIVGRPEGEEAVLALAAVFQGLCPL